jgi:hypothetical protein
MANGNTVTDKLNRKSGPKRDALICEAVCDLQNGQAIGLRENNNKIRQYKIFTAYIMINTVHQFLFPLKLLVSLLI